MMLTGRTFSRYLLTLLGAVVLASCAPREVPLDVHVGGRTVVAPDDPSRHTYTWPGVYFEARFSGPTVRVEVDDDQNALLLLVDGERRITLPRPGRQSLTLNNLGDGEHTIRLEKLSETQGPTGQFLGFFVPDANAALPAPRYEHIIEFIGDSNTVGYGNTANGRECTAEQVRDTTNTSLAFGPQVARHFGADYRIIASSGFGMVRNYAGGSVGTTMPNLYERTLHDDPNTAPLDDRLADVIVIGLGGNDFSTPLGENEAWADSDALRTDYRETYVRFVDRLDQQHSPAHFVLGAGSDFTADVEAVREMLAEIGIDNVSVVVPPELDVLGCHYHLSVRDHARVATLLIELLSGLAPFSG